MFMQIEERKRDEGEIKIAPHVDDKYIPHFLGAAFVAFTSTMVGTSYLVTKLLKVDRWKHTDAFRMAFRGACKSFAYATVISVSTFSAILGATCWGLGIYNMDDLRRVKREFIAASAVNRSVKKSSQQIEIEKELEELIRK